MASPRIRRSLAVLALAAASVIFPLSELSAAPRSESFWSGPQRIVRQGLSFWQVLTSIFERTGARIDSNG